VTVDALPRAILDLIAPLVRDLVSAEVRRVVGELGPVDHGERLYSVRAAAERLEMGESTVRRHIAEGRLRVTHVPGRVAGATELRVRGADLDAFVRQLARDDRQPAGQPDRKASPRRRSRAHPAAPKRLGDLIRDRLADRN